MRRRVVPLVLLVAIVVPMVAGCVTQARIDRRHSELVNAFQKEEGRAPTEQENKALVEIATDQVEAEAAAEREAILSKGLGVVSSALRGDWLSALFLGVGTVGLGAAAVKKAKGAA